MPGINGIALSKKLKELNDNVCIVIISGHSKFEYAREAIQIGVDDYLVKPFCENELLAIIIKLHAKLIKRNDATSCDADLISYKNEKLLNQLLYDVYCTTASDISRFLEIMGIPEHSAGYSVSAIEIDNLHRYSNDARKLVELKNTVIQVAEIYTGTRIIHTVFPGPNNRIISIIGTDGTRQSYDISAAMYQNICDYIAKNYDFTVTIGQGTLVSEISHLKHSYNASLGALGLKAICGGSRVLRYADTKSDSYSSGRYPTIRYEKILMLFRHNDRNQLHKEIERIFAECVNNDLPHDYVMSVAMGLRSVCMSYISEMHKSAGEVLGPCFTPAQIPAHGSLSDRAKHRIHELYERTLDYFSDEKPSYSQTLAKEIRTFIDMNFHDSELSLKKIANYFHMHPDHIRKLYRSETNETLSEYITRIRMEAAKKMIETGNYKLSEIANDVGIKTADYLRKSFKKYYGCSPSDFESQLRNRNAGIVYSNQRLLL